MALHQYIGARYVPKFYENSVGTAEWRSGVIYEPLTIVTYNNNSYTSKKTVPANIGDPSSNPEYWVATGSYNEQISALSGRVDAVEDDLDTLTDRVDAIVLQDSGEPVNVLSLGVDNTGVNDCSAILNQATAEHLLYFPDGTYRLTAPFYIKNSIFGSNGSRPGNIHSTVTGTVFKADFDSAEATAALIVTSNMRGASTGMEIEHISIDCNNKANVSGFKYDPVLQLYGRITMKMEDVHVGNVGEAASGFYLTTPSFISRAIWLNNFSVYAASELAGPLLYIGTNLADCTFSNFELMYARQAVRCYGGTCRFNNGHLYGGRGAGEISDLAAYYAVSIGMDMNATCMCDNIYIDSFKQGFVQRVGSAIIGNMQLWYDTFANALTSSDGIGVRSGSKNSRVIVTNLLVGGAKTSRKLLALILGDHAIAVRMTIAEWDDIDETRPGLLPWISENSLRKSYSIKASEYASNDQYLNFAVAYMGASVGHLQFTAGRGAINSRITVKRSGSTITVTKTADIESSAMNAYYRVSGNFVYFYGIQYGDNFNVEVKSISGSGTDARSQNVLLDVTGLPDIDWPAQVTTDGLTEIPTE